jgi:small subunit ribosomal protein S16
LTNHSKKNYNTGAETAHKARMPVKIRLQRFGRKNLPFYRIVAADSRSPRDGKSIERLGTYNPIPDKDGIKEVALKTDRVRYWLGVGAQPSPTVGRLLGSAGIVPRFPQQFKNINSVPKHERDFSTYAKSTYSGLFRPTPSSLPKLF